MVKLNVTQERKNRDTAHTEEGFMLLLEAIRRHETSSLRSWPC